MAKAEKLTAMLPCPFCNGDRVTHRQIRDGMHMFCVNCGASGPPAFFGKERDTFDRAVAAWNRRAALTQTQTDTDEE